jgi:predicted enzyme related to lactoylglutathione lyase
MIAAAFAASGVIPRHCQDEDPLRQRVWLTLDGLRSGLLRIEDGLLTGGFTTEGAPQPCGPLVVIYDNDLAALSRTIEKAGGRISKPIFAFPGGQRFHFVDPNAYELAYGPRSSLEGG